MNSNTDDVTGDGDAGLALVTEATELAIAESLSHAVEPAAETPSDTTLFNRPVETAMTTAEDFMAFGQANLDALVKSSQIWAAGFQDLGKHMAASAQAQLDQTMSTWKAMAGVKSIKEAVDMHTGLARSTIETAVSETGKLTDASMKLSEQAFAPITARLSVTAEKFGRAAS